MRSSLVRFLCRFLVVCMIALPFQAQAGLIGTDQVVTADQALAARGAVTSVISRADVASQLQALGLSPSEAKDRVAALTDSEVTRLAGQLDSLPAGADAGGVLVLILIGVLIWYLVKR
jgi:hypothetical protein